MARHLFEDNDFLTDTLNAIPFPLLVVDGDVQVFFWNSAALRLLKNEDIYKNKGGDILHCIHSFESNKGCGHSEYCKSCVVRNSVNESMQGDKIYRRKTVMELKTAKGYLEFPVLVTTSPFIFNDKQMVILIMEDVREWMESGGFLPICSSCKKIRTDDNQWQPVESYIKNYIADVKFTHSMCPDCLAKYYSDNDLK